MAMDGPGEAGSIAVHPARDVSARDARNDHLNILVSRSAQCQPVGG